MTTTTTERPVADSALWLPLVTRCLPLPSYTGDSLVFFSFLRLFEMTSLSSNCVERQLR